MSTDGRELADLTQLAAGVVAARHRSDHAGAERLLEEFESAGDALNGFMTLTEIALTLVRSRTGQSMQELVQELNLIIDSVLAG